MNKTITTNGILHWLCGFQLDVPSPINVVLFYIWMLLSRWSNKPIVRYSVIKEECAWVSL